jgi:hypothetical protein
MPTFTKEVIFTIPAGKILYSSEIMSTKIADLKTSGDLISNDIVNISPTQKKMTMVWKDLNAFETWQTWLQESSERTNSANYLSNNNITVSTA